MGMKGVWHYAEVTYPRSPSDFLSQNEEPPLSLNLVCIDANGRRTQGFDMGRRNSEPGKARGATFYSFRGIKLQKLKGPLRFTLEADSEREDWKRTFPEIKVQLKDLPHKIGQKITAK